MIPDIAIEINSGTLKRTNSVSINSADTCEKMSMSMDPIIPKLTFFVVNN